MARPTGPNRVPIESSPHAQLDKCPSYRAECFGLLGNNGAGKTSIFKMLTGEAYISRGDIYLAGYSQRTELNRIFKNIGYCPQFDALLDQLTCRETLEIFSLLRGVPAKDARHHSMNAAQQLDFLEHIDKKVKQLSGGNKRKLSTAISLIGNPDIVLLDEPTTGEQSCFSAAFAVDRSRCFSGCTNVTFPRFLIL